MQDRQPLIDPDQQTKPVAMDVEAVAEHDFSDLLANQSKMRSDDKEEKKTKAFEKLQEKEEKKRRKAEAAAAGPKPRGRPPKAKGEQAPQVDLDKVSTAAEKGSPPVKAPLKKRRVKGAGGGAEGAEPSAGSAKKNPEPEAKLAPEARAEGKAKAEGEVGKGATAEKPGKDEEVPESKARVAQAKRDAKVKLGLCKLADNLGERDAAEMQLPGVGFEGKCWTAVPSGDALVGGCRIRVIPYQETFYVAGAAQLPDYLAPVLKVAWHLVVGF
eukprot:s2663_g10.t1